QDVTAVVDVLVRAVGATESVFIGPCQLLSLDHLEKKRLDRRAVLRVNTFEPPSWVRFAVVEAVAEEGQNAFVPPDLVRPEVPVPDRVIRRLRQGAESLLAFSQHHFRLLSLGDVPRQVHNVRSVTFPEGFGPDLDLESRPVLATEPVFEHDRLPGEEPA